ncbi:hypothetical protein JTS97_11990 [Clostridium botulinum]|nr:hypothetical protein [Clostridium botulinum]MCS4522238.1 hypothetical protein [Clostridium botulinum]
MRSRIKGVGRYLPNRIVTSEEAEELAGFKKLGVRKGLCKMLTGCEERRYSDTNEYSSHIAAKAAIDAMKRQEFQVMKLMHLFLFCISRFC